LGITNFVINMILWSVIIITVMAVILYIGRACVYASVKWGHIPFVGWIIKEGTFVGFYIWVSGTVVGLAAFGLFFTVFMNLLHDPPTLPANQSDVKACSEFLLNTRPADYGPDWLKRKQ